MATTQWAAYVCCIIVEWWLFKFITEYETQENEQEEGAVEERALADIRSEIDSDYPEITNCGGKLFPSLVIFCGHMVILQDYRSEICFSIL